jgi:hypothetical protein
MVAGSVVALVALLVLVCEAPFTHAATEKKARRGASVQAPCSRACSVGWVVLVQCSGV